MNVLAQWERDYIHTLAQLQTWGLKGDRWKGNRTATRTVGGFGLQLDVPLIFGQLPAMVSKTVHINSVIHELLWFLKGDTNIAYLKENGCSIWNGWATETGDLGPVYGKQWRSWQGVEGGFIDQIAKLVYDLKNNPTSRRMIVSAWNPDDLPDESVSPQANVRAGRQALAPCHMLFQAYVEELTLDDRITAARAMGVGETVLTAITYMPGRGEAVQVLDDYRIPKRGLRLRVDQRSADWFLGVPFNILSYALLTHILCEEVGNLVPLGLCMQFGDYHLYEDQMGAAGEQIERYLSVKKGTEEGLKKLSVLNYPQVRFPASETWQGLETLDLEDIQVSEYLPWGRILAPVAI